MLLVVDTNVLFAAVARDSTTRRIILSTPIRFAGPKFVFDELLEHMGELCVKNGQSPSKNLEIIGLLRSHVTESSRYPDIDYMEEANRLMGAVDPDDVPVLATALSLKCDGIWSDDRHFEKQRQVKVWKTRELVHFIRDSP